MTSEIYILDARDVHALVSFDLLVHLVYLIIIIIFSQQMK